MGSRYLLRSGVMAASGSALAACVVLGVAAPAFAHSAEASVTQTCINGTSRSTVVFTNDYALRATLTYSGPAAGSLVLQPNGTGSVNVTVAAAGKLNYTVRWDDGVGQGTRSVPLQPINNCLPPVASTTAETLGVTLVPLPTTTVPPAAEIVTPTPSTPSVPTPVASPGVPAETPSSEILPAAIAPTAALPATGSGPAIPIAIAAGLLIVGAVLIAGRRWPEQT
jgi:hypothetical protein